MLSMHMNEFTYNVIMHEPPPSVVHAEQESGIEHQMNFCGTVHEHV